MPETFYGLPVHLLVVHATVVLVPLTALVLLLAAVSPRFRGWAGWLPVGLAVVSVVLAPLSTSSGENVEHQVGESTLVEQHAHLGEEVIWYCLGMLAVAVAITFLQRARRDVGRTLTAAVMVLGVLVSGATMVQIVRTGHSGTKAAWSNAQQSSGGSGAEAGQDGDGD